MISNKALLTYIYWKITFTVNTDASDKKFGDVISQINKPVTFFYIRLIKTKCKYTTQIKSFS